MTEEEKKQAQEAADLRNAMELMGNTASILPQASQSTRFIDFRTEQRTRRALNQHQRGLSVVHQRDQF